MSIAAGRDPRRFRQTRFVFISDESDGFNTVVLDYFDGFCGWLGHAFESSLRATLLSVNMLRGGLSG